MKAYLITPVDIKYSYRATEVQIYEYAKYMCEHGIDARLLITENVRGYKELPNYRKMLARYKNVPKKEVRCSEYVLPFSWHRVTYYNLPSDAPIYFPYSIHDYMANIRKKPKGQKYIIACHSLHLKDGHIIKNHDILESLLNMHVRHIIRSIGNERDNIYAHAITKDQVDYMIDVVGLKRENVFYVPPMADFGIYRFSKNNSRKLRVLHVGGMAKDMQIVLEIIDKLNVLGKLDMFEFYFIGERDQGAEESYKAYANVHFLGRVGDKEKIKVEGSVDALIVPAYESFGRIIHEGIASGLCILTSRRTESWRDFEALGIKLIVTKSGTAEEYIEPMTKLAEAKSRGREIAPYRKSNKEKAAKVFDMSVVLKGITEMFLKVGR